MFRIITPIFLFLSISLFSQKNEIQFEHLSMKDGLSMNPVMSILQDKTGFLWFGTQDGLNKYDGYSFEVFKYAEQDSLSISDNFITSLIVDKNGDIWIGTLNGLNKYDHLSGKFKRYNSDGINFKNDRVYSLLLDNENNLWIGTEEGISLLDIKTDTFINPNIKYPNLSILNATTILCILKDSKENIWFGTSSGLVKYQPKSGLIHSFFANGPATGLLSNNIVLSLFEDKNKQLWVGTLDGLNKYDEKTGKFNHYYFKKNNELLVSTKKNNAIAGTNIYSIVNNYGGNTIRCVMEDSEGWLWIGTDMELVIFNPKTENFLSYKKDLINPNGINDHFIRSIYLDNSQNMWIGTLGNGLNKTNLNPKKFKHYQKKINNPSSLPENYVRSICEDGDKNIWIGTLIGGLSKYIPALDSFTNYNGLNKNTKLDLSDNNVWAVCYDPTINSLWIGTNNGLNLLDLTTYKTKKFLHSDKVGSISDNTIRNIFLDSKNNLWVGTENGLNAFNRKTEVFESYNTSNSEISNNTVWKTIEDFNGNLWLATNDGLNKFDPTFKKFTIYKKGKSNSIAHNGIRTLHLDNSNTLWVGTQNGLNKINLKTMEFTTFQEKEGLPNSFIYAIAEDKKNHLWISTNKGISEFDKLSTFKNYDVYDGLQDYEFNTNACFECTNGDIYFGGPSGLNKFNPDKLVYNNFKSPIVITQIKIIDSIYNKTNLSTLNTLELNYNQNIIQISFASLDYSNVQRNNFEYMLEGFNKKFIFCGNRHYLSFTNLDPGKYKLLIRGTNTDGVWNETPYELTIIIHPPFWKTWWFYSICIILIISSIIFYLKYKTYALLRAKEKLERTVKRRTREVENQKEELRQKNKDITDSITYAKRIQNALLVEEELIRTEFSDAFILYRPKDIVSGDFYWYTNVTTSGETPRKLKIMAAIDCTGHGVPGAFMSLIASDLLNQTIKDKDVNSPGDVLRYLNQKIPLALNKNNKEKINDGMDVAIVAIDLLKNTVYYSGANRPLLIIKNTGEIIEQKATKTAVGGYTEHEQIFENHAFQMEKGDIIYLFSDGYTDQFGGEKNKKLGTKNFKELLLRTSKENLTKQKETLDNFFDEWRGVVEQIDDILVIGIKI